MTVNIWTVAGPLVGLIAGALLASRRDYTNAWRSLRADMLKARREAYSRFLNDTAALMMADHVRAHLRAEASAERVAEAELECRATNHQVNTTLSEIQMISPSPGWTFEVANAYATELFDLADADRHDLNPDHPSAANRNRLLEQFVQHARADLQVGSFGRSDHLTSSLAEWRQWWSARPHLARRRDVGPTPDQDSTSTSNPPGPDPSTSAPSSPGSRDR